MSAHTISGRTLWTVVAFAVLLVLFLDRAVPYPGDLDSVICATSVSEFRPGFLDGKPLYALLGQIVRGEIAFQGGGKADLMLGLARWSALFGWAALVNLFLIARHVHGSEARAWATVALLATTPTWVFFSAVTEKYTLQVFFLTLAVLLWLKGRYVGWGLALGAALGAHLTSVFLAVPCLVSLRRDPARRGDARAVLKGIGAAAAVAAPLYLWVLSFTRGPGAYVAYVRHVVFSEYDFLKALRPDRIARGLLSRPGLLVLLVVVIAAGGALLALPRIRRGAEPAATGQSSRRPGPSRRRFVLALLGIAATVVLAAVYSRNLALLIAQVETPLVALALLRPILILAARLPLGRLLPVAERLEAATSTFLVPWLAVNAIFFTVWDHFWGQFAILIAPPLALIAAGIGAAPDAEEAPLQARRRAAIAAALIVTAVVSAAWRSRDALERNTWTLVREYDAEARVAAKDLPEGSLVIAAWDSASLGFYRPDLEIVRFVSSAGRRPEVWKGLSMHSDVAGDLRQAVREGRRAFVTSRWLELKLDAAADATRAGIFREFDRVPVGAAIFELVPAAR